MSKLQLCTSRGFWVISELINFRPKNCRFIVFFLLLLLSWFMITRPRIPKLGTHEAFINCYVESKIQLSKFNRLLVVSKSILIYQNSRTKTKVQCALGRSPIKKKGVHGKKQRNFVAFFRRNFRSGLFFRFRRLLHIFWKSVATTPFLQTEVDISRANATESQSVTQLNQCCNSVAKWWRVEIELKGIKINQ